MADTPAGAPTVTDHRTPPRGVLPRGTQTWLMVGLAVVILGIIVVTGHPTPASRTAATANVPALAPRPDQLRDYQDRLRVIDDRVRQQAVTSAPMPTVPIGVRHEEPRREAPRDALEQERRRREHDSLFASNVVLSRRADSDRPTTGSELTRNTRSIRTGLDGPPIPPS